MGLPCGFEIDELSCEEDDEFLSETGEAIDDDLIRVVVACG